MSKERRLGRGLEALLGRSFPETQSPQQLGLHMPSDQAPIDGAPADAGSDSGADPFSIKAAEIDRNPFQPRREFDAEEIAALSESLREHGLIQPIIVRRVGPRYQLIAGERRLRAATAAGWTEIPALVREADDRQVAELAIVENLQRKDLNPLEKAASFEQYLQRYRCTQEELAGRLHIDRSTIANLIRLLELPASVQDAIRGGAILARPRPRALAARRRAGADRILPAYPSRGTERSGDGANRAGADPFGRRRAADRRQDAAPGTRPQPAIDRIGARAARASARKCRFARPPRGAVRSSSSSPAARNSSAFERTSPAPTRTRWPERAEERGNGGGPKRHPVSEQRYTLPGNGGGSYGIATNHRRRGFLLCRVSGIRRRRIAAVSSTKHRRCPSCRVRRGMHAEDADPFSGGFGQGSADRGPVAARKKGGSVRMTETPIRATRWARSPFSSASFSLAWHRSAAPAPPSSRQTVTRPR